MTPEQCNALTAAAADWINARSDLCGLAVTGSWARGNPRPESDLDLILLSREPSALADPAFLAEIDFAAAGFQIASIEHVTYGAVWSWHVHLLPPADLELTIAPLAWATIEPIEGGTRAIVTDAFRVVVDKENLLRPLIEAVLKTQNPTFPEKTLPGLTGIEAHHAEGGIQDPSVRIRKATAEDVPGIFSIGPVASSYFQREQQVRDAIAANGCWIATRHDEIAAYAILNYSFFSHGFIPVVHVSRRHRRSGVASRLLRRLELECGTAKLFTSTNQSNQAMRALLAALGYREVGMIDGLDEGDPEVFYLKTLRT